MRCEGHAPVDKQCRCACIKVHAYVIGSGADEAHEQARLREHAVHKDLSANIDEHIRGANE
eukprot:3928997-Pleurochrysis_carterae.AAC.1